MSSEGKKMKQEQHRIIITRIGNALVRTVLDDGFTSLPGMSPEAHAHYFYELILSTKGCISIKLHNGKDGREIILDEGDACLIPPSVYHGTRAILDDAEKLAVRFVFSPTDVKGDVYRKFDEVLSGVTAPITLSRSKRLFEIADGIKEELSRGVAATDEYLSGLLTLLYVTLIRLIDDGGKEQRKFEESGDTDKGRMLAIEEYMFSHFSEPITEEDLATAMNLSVRQVSRVLHDLFGQSFRQMLIDIRLHRAAQLLAETDMPLDAVAREVGYTSISGFYYAFEKRFSISVGRFRAAARK